MVQIFIKAPNIEILILELDVDYTISAKELYVKVFNLFYKSINKNLIEYLHTVQFIQYSYLRCNNKIIRYNDETYFNSNSFDNFTIDIVLRASTEKLDDIKKNDISGILSGYY